MFYRNPLLFLIDVWRSQQNGLYSRIQPSYRTTFLFAGYEDVWVSSRRLICGLPRIRTGIPLRAAGL